MAISLKRRNRGLFNNYVTQKFPFFDTPTPPTPLPSPSRFITNGHKTPPPYVTSRLTQIPLFIIYFSSLKLKKNPKDTHPPMAHPPMFLSNETKLSGLNKKD